MSYPASTSVVPSRSATQRSGDAIRSAKARWNSAIDMVMLPSAADGGTHLLQLRQHAVIAQSREIRLVELEGHARQVAAARRGAFEQCENLGRAGAGVRIEIGAEQAAAAGDVDLADGVEIESVDEAVGVEAEIDGVDMEVVQVEQQAAAGPPDQRVHEVLLAHVRSRHGR